MAGKFNYCSACYCKRSCNLCRVTEFVLYFKCNCMCTSNKSCIFLGGEHIACDSGLEFNTVNENLTGIKIKSCIIRNCCRECNLVSINYSIIFKRNSGVGCRICRSCNCGKNSVINSGAVVESKIIKIECIACRNCGLYIITHKARLSTGCTHRINE